MYDCCPNDRAKLVTLTQLNEVAVLFDLYFDDELKEANDNYTDETTLFSNSVFVPQSDS